jgi:hypothetical protein
MDVYDKGAKSSYFTAGGCLGVMANMSLTKLAFAIFAMELRNQLMDKWNIVTKIRIAGDDFTLLMLVRKRLGYTPIGYVKSKIAQQVGHLKEYNIVCLNDVQSGSIIGQFCKKNVLLSKDMDRNGRTWYRIRSVSKLPVMVQLFVIPTNDRARDKAFQEMISGIRDLSRHLKGTGYINLYAWLFYKIHDLCLKASTKIFYNVEETLSLLQWSEGFCITKKALSILMSSYPILGPDGTWYYTSTRDSAIRLVYLKALTMRTVKMSNRRQDKYTLLAGKYERAPWDHYDLPYSFHRPVNIRQDQVDVLIKLFRQCKEVILMYQRQGYIISYDR